MRTSMGSWFVGVLVAAVAAASGCSAGTADTSGTGGKAGSGGVGGALDAGHETGGTGGSGGTGGAGGSGGSGAKDAGRETGPAPEGGVAGQGGAGGIIVRDASSDDGAGGGGGIVRVDAAPADDASAADAAGEGGAALVCGGLGSSQLECDGCLHAQCCAESSTCGANQACLDLLACDNACATGDNACLTACAQSNAAGTADLTALVDCLGARCEVPCLQGGSMGIACTRDADCGASGLVCAKDSGDAFFGGGPAGGYCTLDCSAYALGDATSDPCGAFGSLCAQFDASHAYCMQTCTIGPDTSFALDPQKCHGRADSACTALYDGAGNVVASACVPVCQDDAACPSGRSCDVALGVCVPSASASTGAPFGSYCDPNAAGSAGCAGVCITVTASGGGSAGVCSQTCVLGNDAACGFTKGALGSSPVGECKYAVAGNGGGDEGYCQASCDVDSDCPAYDYGAVCDTSLAATVGHGVCVF